MAIVDYTYYIESYKGGEVAESDFATLELRAEELIGEITCGFIYKHDINTLPEWVQKKYKFAICSQIEYYTNHGLDVGESESDVGFSVGKVRVDGANSSASMRAYSNAVAPRAIMFLSACGMLNRSVSWV